MAEYRVLAPDGSDIMPGDVIVDFRGRAWQLVTVTRGPEDDKEPMVSVTALGSGGNPFNGREFYLRVFPGVRVVTVAVPKSV